MSVYRQGRAPVNACPRCLENLIPVTNREGVRHCEKCGGIFADLATSNRILETLDRELLGIGFVAAMGKSKPKDDGRPITCPECQTQMLKNRIESAACDVDACPLHGTWFDTGELVDVMRALERARKKGIILKRDVPSVPIPLADEDKIPFVPQRSLIEWLEDWWSGR